MCDRQQFGLTEGSRVLGNPAVEESRRGLRKEGGRRGCQAGHYATQLEQREVGVVQLLERVPGSDDRYCSEGSLRSLNI